MISSKLMTSTNIRKLVPKIDFTFSVFLPKSYYFMIYATFAMNHEKANNITIVVKVSQ